MSRSTLVKYKGKTIADLGRTIKPGFLSARGENLTAEQLRTIVTEDEDDLKKYISKTIVALAAHHPTKDELEEIVMDLDSFIEDLAESFKEIGMARLLIDLSDEENVDIELN